MQRDRRLVWQGHAGDNPVDVLAGDRLEQRPVEGAANPSADCRRAAVHAGFNGRVVRRLLAKMARRGVSDDAAALFGGEQPMPRIGHVRIEPRLTALDRKRREIERDRRMDDVVVVYLRQFRQIARRRHADGDPIHG